MHFFLYETYVYLAPPARRRLHCRRAITLSITHKSIAPRFYPFFSWNFIFFILNAKKYKIYFNDGNKTWTRMCVRPRMSHIFFLIYLPTIDISDFIFIRLIPFNRILHCILTNQTLVECKRTNSASAAQLMFTQIVLHKVKCQYAIKSN